MIAENGKAPMGGVEFALFPVAEAVFTNQPLIKRLTTEALACGFSFVGDYQFGDLLAYVRAFYLAPNIFAVAYEHQSGACWWDLGRVGSDNSIETWCNLPQIDYAAPPWHALHFCEPNSPFVSMFAKLRSTKPTQPAADLAEKDFESHFCDNYRREIAWHRKLSKSQR